MEPTTAPAIAPEDILLESLDESLPVAGLGPPEEEGTAVELEPLIDEVASPGHPSVGNVGANPSMGCANAWSVVVVSTHGSTCVRPSSSYLVTVTVCDKTKLL